MCQEPDNQRYLFCWLFLCSFIAISIEFKTTSGSNPVRIIVPASWASGRSIELRRDMAGKLRIADSSLIVPLSEIVHRAFI